MSHKPNEFASRMIAAQTASFTAALDVIAALPYDEATPYELTAFQRAATPYAVAAQQAWRMAFQMRFPLNFDGRRYAERYGEGYDLFGATRALWQRMETN